jgi:hypothetical protein
MNIDINGLLKEDINDAIDRGRIWLENHYRVGNSPSLTHSSSGIDGFVSDNRRFL